jgi:hypothetical protein
MPTLADDFLKNLHDRYEGQALIEIDRCHSEVGFRDGKSTYLGVTIKPFLGVPVRIGTLYRMEACGSAAYEERRHGRLSWSGACIYVLCRALDETEPGASSLLDFDPPAITGKGIRCVMTGVCEEPFLFRVKLPENLS